jgi:hypothetical protein
MRGGQMNKRFAARVASAATATLLLGACSGGDDSSPTTSESTTTTSEPAVGTLLARGEDVELVGIVTSGLRKQTLNIEAHQQAGEATGEVRFDDNVIRVECADTVLDGNVVLGGTATAGSYLKVGDLYALIIREGEPDRVALVPNEYTYTTPGGWGGYLAESCDEFLELIPMEEAPPAGLFVEVDDGSDIETG